MSVRRCLGGLGITFIAACSVAPVDRPANTSTGGDVDHAAVVAAVQSVLDAISGGDPALLRRMMTPDARIVAMRPGRPPAPSTVDDMAAALADTPRRFTERMWDPEVRVDGPIASVWAPYDFYLDGEYSHCGVDTFHLLLVDGGWRVQSLVYNTLQPPECELHPQGPPEG